MAPHHGKFVWYELMADDMAAAATYYAHVVGWGTRDSGVPGMAYTILEAEGRGVAGLMTVPEEARKMGAGPMWLGYVEVDDADAGAASVETAGGKILRAPADIPGVGRFAVVADPQGAVFMLFTPGPMPEPPPAPAPPGTPGHIGWRELHAVDGPSAFDFYAGQFGWAKGDGMDMGALGVYQIFTIGGVPSGGIFTKPAAEPMPYWLYYFNVPSIEAASVRVTGGGGKVLNGPTEVPGGDWILHCLDPQGAAFALVGPKG